MLAVRGRKAPSPGGAFLFGRLIGLHIGTELPFQVNPPPRSVLILSSRFFGDVPQYDLFPYGTEQNGSPFRSEERKCQRS
jgi:hypothetical protein